MHTDPAYLSQPERLQALQYSGLLRHDVRGRLDLLCETAATILHVPVAQLNVLDDKLQVSVGKWPPDDDRETPVPDTGCKSVVLARSPVVVPDTRQHADMCRAPFVVELGMLAYLGVPVYYAHQVIGSFCIVDFEVREWTRNDVKGLEALARLAGLSVSDDAP